MRKQAFALLVLLLAVSCSTTQERKVDFIAATSEDVAIREKTVDIAVEQALVEKDGRKFKKRRVKKGESLWKISAAEYGSGTYWRGIAEDNGLREPYLIKSGTILLVSIETTGKKQASAPERKFEYRALKNTAFGVGEKFTFAIKYFGVTAGLATLEVRGIEKINDRDTYLLAATARTAPFFEVFYRVRDLITSNMDVLGLFSWKYAKKLEEGTYRNNSFMEFFHEEGYAKKNDGTKCAVPAFVQDVLSEFYYYRAVFTGKEERVTMDTASDECKSYEIVVEKVGEETVTVDAGTFDCWRIRPHLKYEGIFRQQGDVDIWLTRDENRIPVLVKSKIIIGTIDAVLQEAVVVKDAK
ncbi:MAG TPA: DUF3108 domain-containing protein [Candidatus Goldiibacteriota bacterium]|nr:DUF3108 domain-containing protein [Candidatus Goldiibacteriota bacterium]